MRWMMSAALAAVLLAAGPGVARAAELKILGSRVTQVVVNVLAADFEKTTGFKPYVISDVAAVSKRRVESGEPVDVAVLVDFQIDDLIKKGLLVGDTRADIMSSGIGVAVKRGARKPDISTVAAFKQAMLDAKSITYLKEGGSTIQLRKVFAELGITDAVTAKAIETMGDDVSDAVAEGRAELGLIVIPNILTVPGAELVGPLPTEINKYIMFTAGVSVKTPNQQVSRDLIKLLKSPAALQIIKANGNDPA